MKSIAIQKISIIILLSLFLTSCDDFLTTVPESDYSTEGFYESESDFEYAIAGAYAAQQELFEGTTFFRFTIGRSDDTNVMETNTYMYGGDTFTDGDDCSALETAWSALWVVVNRCNAILSRIDDVDFDDADMKSYITGEAYALRAWSYYTLASSFGGMPLIDKEMSAEETKTVARSTQEETFTFAAADYEQAIDLLPDSWTGDNLGRVTKYAAEGGLARLYMFQSDFLSAKPYLNDIINSGLYGMENQYKNCFTEANENGKERVWEVQFCGGESGEGQGFSGSGVQEGYSGDLSPFSGSSAAMHASSNLLAEYEEGDLRKDVTVVTGLTINGIVEEYYYFTKFMYYSTVPQSTNDWGINLPVLRYTDVLMMYAECLNEDGYVAGGEAFSIINKVRDRAGLVPLTSSTVTGQEAFRQALIHERRIEFAFESLRWPDLVRWGIAKDVMTEFLKDEDEGGGIYSMDGDYRKIYAIPADELSRYSDENIMWQNPEY